MIGLGVNMQMIVSAPPSIDGKYQIACTNGYLYVSTDYGVTFTASGSSLDWRASAINNDGTIMYAVAYGDSVYKSTDYGDTWNQITALGIYNWIDVAMSADGTYVIISSENYWPQKTSNGGVNWSIASTAVMQASIAISGTGQYQILCGTATYWIRSTDYGATWEQYYFSQYYYGYPFIVYMSKSGQYAYFIASQIGYSSTDYAASISLFYTYSDYIIKASMSGNGQYGLRGLNQSAKIYRSTNFLSSFSTVTSSTSSIWYRSAISYSGKYMLAMRIGYYMYRSSNFGVNWTAVNTTVRDYVHLSINNFNG